MTESSEYLGLEQSCIRPGRWLIEGYDVRNRARGKWYISRDGKDLALARSLTEAREWIEETIRETP